MEINLPIPDDTTVSRRVRNLSVDFVTAKPRGKLNLILDSSGIKVVVEKEWPIINMAQKKGIYGVNFI